MSPEVFDKWLEALHSGTWKQTKHALHDEDGFCCLGVLCEIAGVPSSPNENSDNVHYNYNFGDTCDWEIIPDEFLGIPMELAQQWAEMNDNGYSFNEIAEVIETYRYLLVKEEDGK